MTIIKIIITVVAIVLAGCVERQKQGANTMEYYNFVIQGQPVGYFEIEHTDTLIYMNAKMIMGSDKFENPFWIRVRNGVPYEVKFGSDNSEWKKVPLGAYPTSAYPLLLNDNIEKYSAYVEGSGELRERRLVNESGFIVEYDENNEIRRFKIESGKVVSISWGGSAVSTLQNSRDAAIHGTEFK